MEGIFRLMILVFVVVTIGVVFGWVANEILMLSKIWEYICGIGGVLVIAGVFAFVKRKWIDW